MPIDALWVSWCCIDAEGRGELRAMIQSAPGSDGSSKVPRRGQDQPVGRCLPGGGGRASRAPHLSNGQVSVWVLLEGHHQNRPWSS